MPIHAIIFDLGETLLNYGDVDINHLFAQGAQLTYDYLRTTVAPALRPLSLASYRRRNLRAIKLRVLWSHLTRRELDCRAVLQHQLNNYGVYPTDPQLDEILWLWYQHLSQTAVIEPDLHQSLRALRDLDVRLAIISNTMLPPVVLDRHLRQLDLLGFFPVRCYSSATVFRKPDPRIFRAALDQLAVPAAAAVMVGDKYRPDILGARRVGINPVFKRGPLNHSQKIPPQVPTIERIADLPPLIRTWDQQEGRVGNSLPTGPS